MKHPSVFHFKNAIYCNFLPGTARELEGTQSRLRTHADEWLRHLANVNEARTKHPQNRRWLVMPPREYRWIAVLVCKVLICKVNLSTLWPLPLTFEPQNSITSRLSQGHSLYQVWTLCDHSFLSYAADKQTCRQTDKPKILPTLTDIVGVGNDNGLTMLYIKG